MINGDESTAFQIYLAAQGLFNFFLNAHFLKHGPLFAIEAHPFLEMGRKLFEEIQDTAVFRLAVYAQTFKLRAE